MLTWSADIPIQDDYADSVSAAGAFAITDLIPVWGELRWAYIWLWPTISPFLAVRISNLSRLAAFFLIGAMPPTAAARALGLARQHHLLIPGAQREVKIARLALGEFEHADFLC